MNNQIKEAKKRFKPTDTTYCSPVLNVFTCDWTVRVSRMVTDKINAYKGDYVTLKIIKGKLYLVKSTKEEGFKIIIQKTNFSVIKRHGFVQILNQHFRFSDLKGVDFSFKVEMHSSSRVEIVGYNGESLLQRKDFDSFLGTTEYIYYQPIYDLFMKRYSMKLSTSEMDDIITKSIECEL
jgi:hypothetical protein